MSNVLNYTSQSQDMINSFNLANEMITKSYLEKLTLSEIAKLTIEEKDISLENSVKLFNLTRLVINKKEKFIEQLTTIANVAYATSGTMVSIIKSDGIKVEYYIGVVAKESRGIDNNSKIKTRATLKGFEEVLFGNLSGSDLSPLSADKLTDLHKIIFQEGSIKTVCAISGVPAFRNKNNEEILGYAQGIEHMIDSLRGQKYSIISIADPIRVSDIAQIKRGYELIYSQLSTFLKNEVTINETNTYSLTDTQSKSITDSITKGIAMTQSKTKTDGRFSAVQAGVGISFIASVNLGISKGMNSSLSDSHGETKSENSTSSTGTSNSRSSSSGKTTGNSIQFSYENRTVKSLLEKIDKHLERLDLCESFGAFDCATYVISDDRSAALSTASNFNAIIRGEESSVQASYINTWYKESDSKQIMEYLKCFSHPRFYLSTSDKSVTNNKMAFSPAAIMTAKEATLLMALPRQSVPGIPVLEMVPFGRNIESSAYLDETVTLGKLYHMSKDEELDVSLNCQSLASHTFITGSTGSGKSNAIYKILDEANKKQIKFLVIEPAKGEYKHVFGNRKDVSVFGTNSSKTPMLKINPFRFPKDIHVLEHIDRLIEIFNVCWPMYAAMPAVMKDAIERAYIVAGWNLDESTNRYKADIFPSFSDILVQLNIVINESDYSQELKSNYIGALVTRVKSLTNGINGQIFVSDEIDNNIIFNSNTIIDLSRVASLETKAMIMGILVMRLQEYRMAEGGMNRKLHHITVLEEAHNLLKRTSTEQISEGTNILGKSVEMLANSIAEMRTYGEGFIITDQSPSMLDLSVIRNTNTKIILRLPDLTDRELVGRSASLNDEQIAELAKLSTGVAAVFQNNWLEPVLCHVDKFNLEETIYSFEKKAIINKDIRLKSTIIRCILGKIIGRKVEYNLEELEKRIYSSNFSTEIKLDVIRALSLKNIRDISCISGTINKLLDGKKTFEFAKSARNIEEWNEMLISSMDNSILNLEDDYINVVLQCLIREKRFEDKTFDDTYEKWTEYMRGKLQ